MPTTITRLLPDTVDVLRDAPVPLGWGKAASDFYGTPHLTGIRGRIRPLSLAERTTAQQEQTFVTHIGYFEPEADVIRSDVVVRAGIQYRVVGRLPPSLPHHLKVELEELQKG